MQGQPHFYNKTSELFTFFTVFTFAPMVQRQIRIKEAISKNENFHKIQLPMLMVTLSNTSQESAGFCRELELGIPVPESETWPLRAR